MTGNPRLAWAVDQLALDPSMHDGRHARLARLYTPDEAAGLAALHARNFM